MKKKQETHQESVFPLPIQQPKLLKELKKKVKLILIIQETQRF